MADDVLLQKLASIDRCLRSIRVFVDGDLDRLSNQMVQDAVVLNVQRAWEQAIDAACRVVSQRRLGVPSDSVDAFNILGREGLLTKETVANMRSMVGFRNIAVHQYQQLDPAIVRAVIERHLGDFERFCAELA